MEGAELRRATDAPLERRVERLEQDNQLFRGSLARLESQMEVVKTDIGHTRDLINAAARESGAQFTQLHAGNELIRGRIHELANQMQGQLSDPAATVLGRTFHQDITSLKVESAKEAAEIKAELKAQALLIQGIEKNQDQQRGALTVLRFIGFSGLAAAVGALGIIGSGALKAGGL